jgi:hypothetical protein
MIVAAFFYRLIWTKTTKEIVTSANFSMSPGNRPIQTAAGHWGLKVANCPASQYSSLQESPVNILKKKRNRPSNLRLELWADNLIINNYDLSQ